LQRKIVKTADGSTTIQLPEWNEQYHSMHGAIQEARHVFLKMGLDFVCTKNPRAQPLHVLEIGFGTGLNAFLTLLSAEAKGIKITYEGVEAYPVLPAEINSLNYIELLEAQQHKATFDKMHATPWEETLAITEGFQLKKRQQKFQDIDDGPRHDLIYFDAFGARVQPELWEEYIFDKMHNALLPGGALVTYAAKGSVRRAMQAVGLEVERLPGPPGKREMLRAVKK
tara:strand:- start:235 stop:912 length:678 start_codon:yes stop_codon:yes gene_type:complete